MTADSPNKEATTERWLWLREMTGSKFYHDLRHLVGRQLLMKCFSLVAVTYAMRRLGPVGLGELGYALATVSVLLLFANLGVDQLLPKSMAEQTNAELKESTATRFYSMRVMIVFCCAPVFVAGAFFQWWKSPLPDLPQLANSSLIWLAAYLFLFGNTLNPEAYQQGKDEVKQLGDFQLRSVVLSSVLFGVFFTFFPSPPIFLLIQALTVLYIAWQAFEKGETARSLWPQRKLPGEALKHVRTSWPTITNIFVMFCFGGMDGLFLPMLTSSKQVGLYAAANTLCNGVNAFLALIPLALYPRILSWAKISPALAAARTVKIAALLLLSVPFAYLASRMVCGFAVPLILGEAYRDSSPVLAALMVQFLAYIGYYAITFMLVAVERYRLALSVSMVGAVLGLIIYPLAVHFGGALFLAHGKLAVYCAMVASGLGLVISTKKIPDKVLANTKKSS